MKKSAKIVLIVLACVVIVAAGIAMYCYFNPMIHLSKYEPADRSGSYAEMPALAYSTYFNMPLPAKTEKNVREFWDDINTLNNEIIEKYPDMHQIDCSIEVKNGQTIVSFSGTVTDDAGKTVDFERELVFDFVLAKYPS